MQHIDENREIAQGEIFQEIDAMVLPTTVSSVPRVVDVHDAQALSPQNTFFANYFGLPALSVPCGFDQDGLPIGLQIVGKQGGDEGILQIAQAYQEATDWVTYHPHI